MFSFREIIEENTKTFYNYRTGKPASVATRYVAICLAGFAFALLFGKLHDNLYAALIAVESILVGFSFNVLIYLSSNHSISAQDPSALEDAAKVAKLKRLSFEVFYNISYFTLTALCSIIVASALIAANAYSASFDICNLVKSDSFAGANCLRLERLIPVLKLILIWAAFVTFVDSISSFARITKRMTYLFKEKIALESSGGA